jgi:hypothetical protein
MRKLIVLFIAAMLAAGSLCASESVLLFRFRGVGVDEELIDAVMLVFQGALEEEGGYSPVSVEQTIGYVDCHDLSCAASLARDEGFAKAITGSITRLGAKIIVRIHLVDARREKTVFSDDGESMTEDDLDIVLKRLARGVTSGKTMEETAEVGMITEREFEKERRRESYSSKGVKVGFLWPTSGSMGGTDRLTVLHLAYQYDTPDFFMSGRSGIHWGGDIDEQGSYAFDLAFFDAKLGKYFNRGDFTPFVNLGVGIHWVKAKDKVVVRSTPTVVTKTRDDSGTGLALIAGGGFTAFRTYNFQFQVDVDFIITLTDLEAGGNPQGVMFTFCIMKGRTRH